MADFGRYTEMISGVRLLSRATAIRRVVALAIFGTVLALIGAASALEGGPGAASIIAMVCSGVFALWGIAGLSAMRCRRFKP